jgi:hypothetical protein
MKRIATFVVATAAIALTASAQETSLRDQILGLYSGAGQGYEYMSDLTATYGTYFNVEDYGTVTVRAGEGDADVVIENLFPAIGSFNQTGVLKGTVVSNSDYEGYQGYILVEPGQFIGTFQYSDDVAYDLTLCKTDWNWNKEKENAAQFWIYTDGSIETDNYATAIYQAEYDGVMYDYWGCILYSKLTRTGDLPVDHDAELRDQLLGEYGGTCMGGDYATNADFSWSNYPFSEFNTDTVPAVVVSAGEAANQVVVENLFPKDSRFEQKGLVGTVTYDTTYSGYLGWIEFPTQEVGTFDGAAVTCRNMDYTWVLSDNSTYLWILESGELYGDSYFCLRYPGTDYEMYLYYVWADLVKGQVGSVNGIAAEATGATEYYNLNGIRVNGNNLPAGIYIMRQGTKATKIAVK